MLVLSRKTGQTIMIGDDIYLTVLGVKGNQIRLGIDAPEEVAVHREEIYMRIKQNAEPKAPVSVTYRRAMPKIDACSMLGAA